MALVRRLRRPKLIPKVCQPITLEAVRQRSARLSAKVRTGSCSASRFLGERLTENHTPNRSTTRLVTGHHEGPEEQGSCKPPTAHVQRTRSQTRASRHRPS